MLQKHAWPLAGTRITFLKPLPAAGQ